MPHHNTLSRHTATLEVPRPSRPSGDEANGESEPTHLLVESTGTRLCGAGKWLLEKHGTHARWSWRKPHVGLEADIGQVVVATLTDRDVDGHRSSRSLARPAHGRGGRVHR